MNIPELNKKAFLAAMQAAMKAEKRHDFTATIREAVTAYHSALAPPANPAQVAMEALRFYADPSNWIDTPSWDGDTTCMTEKAIPVVNQEGSQICDCGDVARKALSALSNPPAQPFEGLTATL